jgi:transposase-like protein
MRDIYGIEVSADLVSKITDNVIPVLADWQSSLLERVYPNVFLEFTLRFTRIVGVLNKATTPF